MTEEDRALLRELLVAVKHLTGMIEAKAKVPESPEDIEQVAAEWGAWKPAR